MTFKRPFFLILFVFIFLTTFISAQTILIDKSKGEEFISEVYKGVEVALGYDKPENVQRFMNLIERFEIVVTKNNPEKYSLLSDVPVINLYNKKLFRDEPFDPYNFNPLKYKFDTTSFGKKVYYRVDDTDYMIIIHPE